MSSPEVEIQAFLYRSMVINRHLGLGEVQIGNKTPDTIANFSTTAQAQAKFMGSVYELLYCLENSIRELIESTLREALGPQDWWEVGIDAPIRRGAEKRRTDDAKARWHGPRGDSLLSYVDFPQYAEIIEGQWLHFEPLLGDSEWVSHYFAS